MQTIFIICEKKGAGDQADKRAGLPLFVSELSDLIHQRTEFFVRVFIIEAMGEGTSVSGGDDDASMGRTVESSFHRWRLQCFYFGESDTTDRFNNRRPFASICGSPHNLGALILTKIFLYNG
jgi:hypothetical protein